MAKVGGFFFERSNADSPETFTRICETKAIPQFGKTNALAESTTFCDDGNKTYIPGQADGQELSITMNREADSAVQELLRMDVENKVTYRYRFVEELDGSPAFAWTFAAAALTWGIVPSLTEANDFMFGAKISGAITRSAI